nr:MAG TPA: hypothetical protein [Caudoviricetes sp.]
MSKAVLISIRPEWVNKILAGKKTLEVRKTRPKLETPFKVYIYCTNPKNIMLWNARSYIYADDHSHNAFDRCWNGSVVGEFICNNITEDTMGENCDILCVNGCMGLDQIKSYGGNKKLYGWHISDLKIYETPKELTEFHTWKKCKSCSKSGYESTACIYDENCMVPVAITKAPQSWCYVEELK